MLELKMCKYCKKIFYKKDFPKGFNRMITCGSNECKKKLKKEWSYSKICLDCNKPITYHAKRCKLCSSKGKNNPFYGKTHSEETKKKLKLFYPGMISPRKGMKLTDAQIEKTASKLRGRKPSKEIIRRRLRRKTPSSLELKMIHIIEKYNLPYHFVGNGSFFIERFNPDFINCNGKKIAIEVYYRKHKDLFQGGVENWKSRRLRTFQKYEWEIIFLNELEVNDKIVERLL